MQERAAERDRVARAAVGAVADDRMPDRREVHADLVRTARLEPALEQAAARGLERVHDLVLRARRLARVAHGHTRAARARAADRRVDHAARRRQAPPHERDVQALDRYAPRAASRATRTRALGSGRRRAARSCRGRGGARSRAGSGSPTPAISGITREQPVDERARRVPGARVHDEARGLGHDHHVVVGVADLDRDLGLRPGDRVGRRARARRATRARRRSCSRWLLATTRPSTSDRAAGRSAPAPRRAASPS